RTDLWSLGVVMFRLLTGRFPFNGESVADLTSSVLKDPVPTLASLNVDAPPRVQAVLDKCLARELDQRWSSAQELQAALRAVLTPELAFPGNEGVSPRPKSAGRWLIVVGISFTLIAIAATLVLGMRKGRNGTKQEGIELTLTADENIRSVQAPGLRR